MQQIRQEIHNCIQQYASADSRVLTHENIFRFAEQQKSSGTSSPRLLHDLVTMIAWTTSKTCQQEMVALSMRELPRAVQISYRDGAFSPTHTHDHIELMYVLEGQATQLIRGKSVSFCEGEICLVNPRVEHCELLCAKESTILWLGIDDIFLEKYADSQNPSDYTQSLKKLINQKRFQYLYVRFTPILKETKTKLAFLTIFSEMLNRLPGKNRLIIGYAERIADLLTKEYHIHISQEDQKELHQAVAADICDYIAGNYAQTNVKDIASVYHYSPDYLNRIFSRETGRTLSSYLQKIRMEHAMQILQTTDLPIEQAARLSGYHNMGFFYKKFKEFYLATPDEARRQYRTSPAGRHGKKSP